jgi:hypothetical protein
MRLLDPIEGLRQVVQCIAFQFVFAGSALSVLVRFWKSGSELPFPREIGCDDKKAPGDCDAKRNILNRSDYIEMDRIALELFVAHMIVILAWTLPKLARCLGGLSWWVFSKFCSIVMMAAYLRAMFIACAEYPKLKTQKVDEDPAIAGLYRWVQLEIRIFLLICAAGIVFLGCSMIRRPNNTFKPDAEVDDEIVTKNDNNVDFMRWNSLTYQIFCIKVSLLCMTAICLISDYGSSLVLEKGILIGLLGF